MTETAQETTRASAGTAGETVPREAARTDGIIQATARATTGIMEVQTGQTIIEAETVPREAARTDGIIQATVRATTGAAGETVPREAVRITAADRAEGTRWAVR